MRKNKPSKIGGFTLLEVLVALSLAGAGLAVLAESFIQSAFTQQKIGGRVAAMVIGSGKLADLERGSELALSGDFSKPYDNYTWSATEEIAPDESVIITLTVEWKEGGRSDVHKISFKGFREPK
jgi:prepilin-type N-terminal cleavage/methylation domain-containing protein